MYELSDVSKRGREVQRTPSLPVWRAAGQHLEAARRMVADALRAATAEARLVIGAGYGRDVLGPRRAIYADLRSRGRL
jgi:hypothetical protein